MLLDVRSTAAAAAAAVMQSWSREKLQEQGLALFDLAVQPDGQLYRDAILRMFVPSLGLPFHALSPVSPHTMSITKASMQARSTSTSAGSHSLAAHGTLLQLPCM
jgi:hypothetical protein